MPLSADAPLTPALALYRRALAEARPHRGGLAVVLLLGLLATPLGLLAPLPLTAVIDGVLGGGRPPWPFDRLLGPGATADELLAAAIAFGFLAAALALVHRMGEWLFREWIGERMVLEYRTRLLAHGLSLADGDHEAASGSALYQRIMDDGQSLQWTALYGWMPLVWSAVSVVVFFHATAALHAGLAVAALATSLPLAVLVHWTQTRLRGAWHRVRTAEVARDGVLMETVRVRPVLAAFGREAFAVDRFRERAGAALTARMGALGTEAAVAAVFAVATAAGAALVLWMGVQAVRAGELTPGGLILVMTYVGQLHAPLQAVGQHLTGQQRALACAERTFALLDAGARVTDPADPVPLGRSRGALTLAGVGFAHPDGTRVLSGVDLAIPAGARVGIVGPSGAGKTTLLGLLTRRIDPTEGSVRLDGTDLRRLGLADLRRQFAPVPQDASLLSLSVAANLALGAPDADRDAARAALANAGAAGLVASLPEGMDTVLPEGGARLSGGERQRLAIARAFLRDAPVLVLDEPTSALDRATEAGILDALDRLAAGRTVLMVTHRADALTLCDLVVTVADGGVAVAPGPRASVPRMAA